MPPTSPWSGVARAARREFVLVAGPPDPSRFAARPAPLSAGMTAESAGMPAHGKHRDYFSAASSACAAAGARTLAPEIM